MKHIRILKLTAFCAVLSALPAPAQEKPTRFDHLVRNDFFAGFNGDAAALERGMRVTAEVLRSDPKHAEALVWHGSGLFFQSGQYFQKGDYEKGQQLWTRSLEMMDRAVELAPDAVAVRIPRGAAVLQASRYAPAQMSKPLIERAAADYARAFELQRSRLAQMGDHPKGELLSGLAEAYEAQGRRDDARTLLEQMVREMAGTPYARRAESWLAEGAPEPRRRACIGCHTAGN